MPKADRQQARLFGLRAESWACALLMAKGYRILARNYVVRGGEIDIIARRGATIAFVEVKARPQFEAALQALSTQKIARISTAARVWLSRNGWAGALTLRGDAIVVAPLAASREGPGPVQWQGWNLRLLRRENWPQHLIAAFELSM